MRATIAPAHAPPATHAQWVPPLVRPHVDAQPRSCCCSARALYQVMLPPTPTRGPVDLLLCGHHFRASLDALSDANAWVYDARGQLLDSVS